MQYAEALLLNATVQETVEVHMVIGQVLAQEEQTHVEPLVDLIIKVQQHDMGLKTVLHTEEVRVVLRLKEELVTIRNLVVIHVLHTIVQGQDDRLILEQQVLETQDTIKLKALHRTREVQQKVLLVHTDLQDQLQHVPLELFDLPVLHPSHQVEAHEEVGVTEEDKHITY